MNVIQGDKLLSDCTKEELEALYKELRQLIRTCSSNIPVTLEARQRELIELLHLYNDIKDACQVILAAIANLEQRTLKQKHKDYNLPTVE